MAKSSIHIVPVKENSEIHNKRLKLYDYIRSELTPNNEGWEKEGLSDAWKRINETYTKTTGQKMQKKATPIREGVVNLNENHTLPDLHKLAYEIENKFGIKSIQIYIHRDEGHHKSKDWKPNLHAHIVFDWTDDKGKSIKLNRQKMSEMQDLVSEVLEMERGQRSDKKHLHPIEYKIQKAQEDLLLKEKEILEIKANIEELKKLSLSKGMYIEKLQEKITQKQAEIKPFIEKNIKVQEFEKDGFLSAFGGKKDIDRLKVEKLISAFEYQKEIVKGEKGKNLLMNQELKKLQSGNSELSRELESKKTSIISLQKQIKVLENPSRNDLENKLREVIIREKEEKEREFKRKQEEAFLKMHEQQRKAAAEEQKRDNNINDQIAEFTLQKLNEDGFEDFHEESSAEILRLLKLNEIPYNTERLSKILDLTEKKMQVQRRSKGIGR